MYRDENEEFRPAQHHQGSGSSCQRGWKEESKEFSEHRAMVTKDRSESGSSFGSDFGAEKCGGRQNEKNVDCPYCRDGHFLDDCKMFCDLTVRQRKHWLFKNERCYNCFDYGHPARDCYLERTCECGERHHSLLCGRTSLSKRKFRRRWSSLRTWSTDSGSDLREDGRIGNTKYSMARNLDSRLNRNAEPFMPRSFQV